MKSIFSLLLVIFSVNVLSQGEWQIISPWPTINDLFDVFFITPQKGWMVGAGGTIVSTSDGGETWYWQYKNNSKYFKSVFFIDENEGWVVGWHDVLHTTSGGEYWEEQDLPGFLDVEAITFINPDTGWIVGTYKTIYKTENGGETWTQKLSGTPDAPMLNDVFFSDALHGVSVGGFWFTPEEEAYVLITDDGGETWQDYSPEGIEELSAVSFISQDTGWACGQGQEVLKTNDGGYSWEVISGFYNSKSDIHFFNQSTGLILSTSRVFSTTDGGINWTENYIPGSPSLNAFSFSAPVGFACGFDGSMYKSEDYGLSWQYTGSEPFASLESVYFADSLNGWAKNISSYFVSKTENGGINWEVVNVGASEILGDLYFLNPSCGYALGYHYKLYKTTDAGENWSATDIGFEGTFECVHFVNEQTGFIGGFDGAFLKTTDGGENWEEVNLMSYGLFKDIEFTDMQNGWTINVAGYVFHTNDGGASWTSQALTGLGFLDDILFLNDQKGFVTTLGGYIFMTENGGNTWEEVYNFSPNYSNRVRIAFVNETEGWFIRGPRLYFSIDGGNSWNFYDFISYMTDICFIDNNNGWILGSNSLMMKYLNITTGINEMKSNTLTIFPNPVSDILSVRLPDTYANRVMINIFDINGKLVISRQIQDYNNKIDMDVSVLHDGLYILEYRTKAQRQTVKFLKK